MGRVPFSLFDFFGILAPAFLLIGAGDCLFNERALLHRPLTVSTGAFALVVTYCFGQMIIYLAESVFRAQIVARLLKYPNHHLIRTEETDEPPGLGLWKKVYSEYFEPLPREIAARITEKLKREGIHDPDAQFFYIYGKFQTDKVFMDRLNMFQACYVFAQNICFCFFLIALAAPFAPQSPFPLPNVAIVIASLLAAVVLLGRFLKLFRQFSLELYVAYASLPEKRPQAVKGRNASLRLAGKR